MLLLRKEPMKTQSKAPHKLTDDLLRVARDTVRQIREAQLLLVASSLAYTTLLSIIPLLALSFAIFQTFGGMEKLYSIIEPVVISNLAKGTGESTMIAIRGFIANIKVKTLGTSGLIALVFTCMSMLSSIEKAINRVWKAEITRHWFQRIAAYWFFITIGPLAFSVAFAFASSQEMKMAKLIPSGTAGFILIIALLTAIYKGVPHRKVRWHAAWIPAVLTALLLAAARNGYTIYTHRIVSYNKIYGSLGAVPIFLVWIYILWILVLGGAAFGAALQKRMEVAKE